MAVGNFIFFILTALVAINQIFAENKPPPQPGGDHQNSPPQGAPNPEPYGRLFVYLTGCNNTATPGATCLNCTTASRCHPNNGSIVRVCGGSPPSCYNGRLSLIAKKLHITIVIKTG